MFNKTPILGDNVDILLSGKDALKPQSLMAQRTSSKPNQWFGWSVNAELDYSQKA
jgi:hypothetical protein